MALSVGARLEGVRAEILEAATAAGRSHQSVQLVAVSKRHPISAIEAAYEAGQRVFGESYADELVAKVCATRHLEGIRFRFIGHLQRNKAARVVEHACAVDSVSSLRLACPPCQAKPGDLAAGPGCRGSDQEWRLAQRP